MAKVLADFKNLPDDMAEEDKEVPKMRIVAFRRANASKTEWVEDLGSRKFCCANGSGTVL